MVQSCVLFGSRSGGVSTVSCPIRKVESLLSPVSYSIFVQEVSKVVSPIGDPFFYIPLTSSMSYTAKPSGVCIVLCLIKEPFGEFSLVICLIGDSFLRHLLFQWGQSHHGL